MHQLNPKLALQVHMMMHVLVIMEDLMLQIMQRKKEFNLKKVHLILLQ